MGSASASTPSMLGVQLSDHVKIVTPYIDLSGNLVQQVGSYLVEDLLNLRRPNSDRLFEAHGIPRSQVPEGDDLVELCRGHSFSKSTREWLTKLGKCHGMTVSSSQKKEKMLDQLRSIITTYKPSQEVYEMTTEEDVESSVRSSMSLDENTYHAPSVECQQAASFITPISWSAAAPPPGPVEASASSDAIPNPIATIDPSDAVPPLPPGDEGEGDRGKGKLLADLKVYVNRRMPPPVSTLGDGFDNLKRWGRHIEELAKVSADVDDLGAAFFQLSLNAVEEMGHASQMITEIAYEVIDRAKAVEESTRLEGLPLIDRYRKARKGRIEEPDPHAAEGGFNFS